MEMSDAQFERIVGLIADSRVELRQGLSDLQIEVRSALAGMRTNQQIIRSSLEVVEGDLGQVQRQQRDQGIVLGDLQISLAEVKEDLAQVQGTQRDQGLVLGQLLQATDGLTQLGKTNFDQTESILKLLHGQESGTVSHGQENRESESGSQ